MNDRTVPHDRVHSAPQTARPLVNIGWVFGIGMLVAGFLVSLTGLGAIVGVPMMIVGALAFFLPLAQPQGVLRGECPSCHGVLRAPIESEETICPKCQSRILVRDGRFALSDK